MKIYTDALLRASVVVEAGGGLWLVPRRSVGWHSRRRLMMTAEARKDRLRPAKGIAAAWLGIPDETGRETAPATHERPTG